MLTYRTKHIIINISKQRRALILEVKLKTENKTRQKIKSFLAMNGITIKEVIKKMNELHPDNPTTAQNITNKLAREIWGMVPEKMLDKRVYI